MVGIYLHIAIFELWKQASVYLSVINHKKKFSRQNYFIGILEVNKHLNIVT